MIFTNGRLIFGDGIRDGLEVVVKEGKIAAICERFLAHGEHEIVDLSGNYLAAGFIDLHVHGALGRDTMEASAEAFRSICDFHASGGTTSLLLTTATAPLNEIVKVLQAVRDSMEQRSVVGTPRCGVRTAQRAVPTLCSRGALFENVIVNRVYIPKGFSRDVGIWNADAKRLFHTYNQLQCIDRIEAQSIRTEKRQLIADLFRRNLKHQVFDQHLLDLGPQIRFRHKRAGILP
jgi:hypothetical protein